MARARLGGADAVAVTQAGLLELNSAAVPAPAGRAAEKAARGQREKWLRSEIYARWAKKGLLRTFKWWPPRRLQPKPRKSNVLNRPNRQKTGPDGAGSPPVAPELPLYSCDFLFEQATTQV